MYDFNAYGKLTLNLDFIQDLVTENWNNKHLNFWVQLKVQASKPKLQKTDAENVQWWHDWSFPDEHYGFPMLPLHS